MKRRTRKAAVTTPFANWCDRGFVGELIAVIPPGVAAKLRGERVTGDGKTPGSKLGINPDLSVRFVAPLYYGNAAWASREGAGFVIGGVTVLAGTVVLLTAYPDRIPAWVVVVVFLALVPIAPVLELRARRWDRLAPVALLGTVLGVYLCVPDTELVRPLVGAALVGACLTFVPDVSATQVGSGVVVAFTLWAVGIEGYARPGSVFGAIGCVAALALFPATETSIADTLRSRSWWFRMGVVALLVLWCSRVAGIVHSGWFAAFLVALGFVVAVGARSVLSAVGRR